MLDNVEAERVRYRLSKKAIAERLGISTDTYAAYVKGKRPMPSDILLALVHMFNKSADYLLGLKNE